MADQEALALHHRFELLKGAEHHKNVLIEVSAFSNPPKSHDHFTQSLRSLLPSLT